MVERKRGEKERHRGEIETEGRKRGKKKIWIKRNIGKMRKKRELNKE